MGLTLGVVCLFSQIGNPVRPDASFACLTSGSQNALLKHKWPNSVSFLICIRKILVQCKVTFYQAKRSVHKLNTLIYLSYCLTINGYLWGHQNLSQSFFQPFTVSGAKQSKSPRKNILCFEDLDTDYTSALQCYPLLFLWGIFRQVFSKGVCNLSDNFL